MINRRQTRTVSVRDIKIGSSAPVSVQSMTNIEAKNFSETAEQIKRLAELGADIVRVAVPDEESAGIFRFCRDSGISIPMVADIHFDYKLALASIKGGADKIRINPGNIGAEWKVGEVAAAARDRGLPIRIGVNGGSLDRALREKYGAPTPEALVESALMQADMLEAFGFSDIVISLKASDVANTIAANRLIAQKCDYPLHLGVTEAGDEYSGLIKNSAGIGSLLCDGIGDTVRISLTASPEREITAGRELLSVLGVVRNSIEIVSCPSCGRTKIDLIGIAAKFKEASKKIDTKGKHVKVAVMGCVVNGPGEARDADFGIAGGDGFAVLFRHGETVGRIEEEDIIPALIKETESYISSAE